MTAKHPSLMVHHAGINEALRYLAVAKRVLLSTHANPDGDGLGAEVALYHYLVRAGRDVSIVNPDAPPSRYKFLDPHGAITVFDGHLQGVAEGFDVAVVVDTGDHRRLGPLWDHLLKTCKVILFLDHHPRLPGELPAPHSIPDHVTLVDILDERSSSIGELLYRLFLLGHDQFDSLNPGFRLSPEIALGLYVSIMTDTNSFRYAKTTALSHRIAADLIDFGLQPEEIYQNVYSTKSAGQLRLIGEILSGVQQSPCGQVAWVEVSQKQLSQYGAKPDDVQTVVNFLLLIGDAKVLCLLREESKARVRVSMKSKGEVVINDVAASFGGGGHQFAAGFSVPGLLSEVRTQLLDRLLKKISA